MRGNPRGVRTQDRVGAAANGPAPGRPPHPRPFSPSKAEGEGRKKVLGFAWMVAVPDQQRNAMRCDDAKFIPCIPATAQRRQTGCTGSAE